MLGRNEDDSERDLCPGRSGYTGSPEQELLGYGNVWGFVCTYIKLKDKKIKTLNLILIQHHRFFLSFPHFLFVYFLQDENLDSQDVSIGTHLLSPTVNRLTSGLCPAPLLTTGLRSCRPPRSRLVLRLCCWRCTALTVFRLLRFLPFFMMLCGQFDM